MKEQEVDSLRPGSVNSLMEQFRSYELHSLEHYSHNVNHFHLRNTKPIDFLSEKEKFIDWTEVNFTWVQSIILTGLLCCQLKAT